MRLAAACLALFILSGCNSERMYRRGGAAYPPGAPGEDCTVQPESQVCGQAPSPPTCPPARACEQPKAREVAPVRPREAPVIERSTGQAAVTQDILLIP